MEKTTKKRNTPIATLMKNYKNKESGKVSVSRTEIKRRFAYLDWKDQKKILDVFLDASPTDREWAYARLLDYWDDSFEPKIRALWETYHEPRCAWSVIGHSPEDYIEMQMDKFTDARSYYFICLRLALNPDYEIDKKRLSPTDYLAVLYHTGRTISDEEATDMLYGIVHDYCFEMEAIPDLNSINDYSERIITTQHFRNVKLALYYLQKLEKHRVVLRFEDWDQAVEEAYVNSREYKLFLKYPAIDYSFTKIRILCFYAYLMLPAQYKHSYESSIEERRSYIEELLRRNIEAQQKMDKSIFHNGAEPQGEDRLPF